MKPKLIETVGNLAVMCAINADIEFYMWNEQIEISYFTERKTKLLKCSINDADKINEFIKIVREL